MILKEKRALNMGMVERCADCHKVTYPGEWIEWKTESDRTVGGVFCPPCAKKVKAKKKKA